MLLQSIHVIRPMMLSLSALLLVISPGWSQVADAPEGNVLPSVSRTALTPAAPANIHGNDMLTLAQAITLARAHNLQLLTASDDVNKRCAEVKATETALRPTVNLMAGAAYQLAPSTFHFDQGAFGSYPGIGPIPGTGIDITESGNSSLIASVLVTQPVTQIPRIRHGIDIKQQQVVIAQEEYRMQTMTLAANVTKVYTAICVVDQVNAANDASIRFLQELEHVVQTNYEQGTVLESELLDVRAKLARQEHIAVTLQHTRTDLCEQLNQLMGRNVSEPVMLVNDMTHEAVPQSLQELQHDALASFPGIRQSSAGITIAQHAYEIRRRENKPDVSLAISYTRAQQLDVLPDQLFIGMVTVTWDSLFDWGKKHAELTAKHLDITGAQRTYADAREKTLLNVNACYRKWQDALAYVDVCQRDVNARREVLRVDLERYHVNTVQLKDVLESEAKLYDAQQQLFTAQADVVVARAALMLAVGKE